MHKQCSQSGQAGLVAILIAMVLSVIGLSVASRASREALVSTSESEGTRTLEGAQSGAEGALNTAFGDTSPDVEVGTGTETGGGIGAGDEVFQSDVASDISNISLDLILEEGMSLELHNSDDWRVYWGNVGETRQAGLMFSCYSGTIATYQGYKPYTNATPGYTGDFLDSKQSTLSGFTSMVVANRLGAGDDVGVLQEMGVSSCEIWRIKALYATTVIRVTNVSQNNIRQVRAAATNLQDDQGRLVEVRETAPGRPSVLDYALFAGTGAIAKN